jgi:hypothetical protein
VFASAVSYFLDKQFTGQELDDETGLYYFGARYLNPQTSMWLSADPAMGEYVPGAPINDEVRKSNQNLPGMGGVFNVVNLHVYHYAGNNPIVYTDPDGEWTIAMGLNTFMGAGSQVSIGGGRILGFSFDKGFTEKTHSLTMGGSGTLGAVAAGGDISIDLETGQPSVSASLGVGPGSPGEAHQVYTTTNIVRNEAEPFVPSISYILMTKFYETKNVEYKNYAEFIAASTRRGLLYWLAIFIGGCVFINSFYQIIIGFYKLRV